MLEFAFGAFKLPCTDTCPFGKACSEKYNDGTCIEKVDSYVSKKIYGTPSPKIVVGDEITFTTVEPDGKISISEGFASVSR